MDVTIISNDDFKLLITKIESLEQKIENLQKKERLNDTWLGINEVCKILNISKRTLQTYRDTGVLAFSQNGTKIYFKASDIQNYFEDNYKPAFKNDKKIGYVE